jgi:hypothetical protein
MRLSIVIIVAFCVSCSFIEPKTIVLWTDNPEFALYSQRFNAAQSQYKVETRYFASPEQKIIATSEHPDIVVGSWLKSTSTSFLFKPLDFLFNGTLSRDAFYPSLLERGFMEGEQYLLPISFNLPALVFAQNNSPLLSNSFTIGLEETKRLGKAYNVVQREVYSRMGFSPNWDDDFLFASAVLFNVQFRDADPLVWNADALESALAYDKAWIAEVNTGIQALDDFSFKYFYDPPAKRVIQGRILFTYMSSVEFLTLDPEQRSSLDFRWLAAEDERIPLIEGMVYYGICRTGKAKKGSEVFTQWFFQPDTQRLLLENGKEQQIEETLFGIAGGFSAVQRVTEEIFPRFYPSLWGHIPPAAFLSPPAMLPQQWLTLKERVILPYMHEYIRAADLSETRSFERRIADWYRINHY